MSTPIIPKRLWSVCTEILSKTHTISDTSESRLTLDEIVDLEITLLVVHLFIATKQNTR
jgi:hypothetical protein